MPNPYVPPDTAIDVRSTTAFWRSLTRRQVIGFMLLTTPFLLFHIVLVNGAIWRLIRLYPSHYVLYSFGACSLILCSIVATCLIFHAVRIAVEGRFTSAIKLYLGTFSLLFLSDFGVCNIGDLLNSPLQQYFPNL